MSWELREKVVQRSEARLCLSEGSLKSELSRDVIPLLLLSSDQRGTLTLSLPLKTFVGSSDFCCFWHIYLEHVQEGI